MKTITVDNRQMAECEDCHKPIEPTTEVRWGFVSPESSVFKPTTLLGIAAVEGIEKVVCKKCYFGAFKRVYPNQPLPKLNGGEIYEQPS